MKIGQGFDVHAFQEGRRLVLGGVTIPYEKGLAAHSDGDVLIHAVCDALLGAAGLGDIGVHFPDTDRTYKDVDSRVLLRRVLELIRGKGLELGNLDATVIAQAPKLAPFIAAMRQNLAEDLGALPEQISVKATTTEHLGFPGRGEGIAAQAVVLLMKPHP